MTDVDSDYYYPDHDEYSDYPEDLYSSSEYEDIEYLQESSPGERERRRQRKNGVRRKMVEDAQKCMLKSLYKGYTELDAAVGEMFNNQRYSDLILTVGQNSFSVHRLVLCAWSDVFKTMLCDPSWQADKRAKGNGTSERRIICQQLVEEEECVRAFGDFLKFLYTSRIELSKDNVLAIARLADKYLVDDAYQVCLTFIKENRDMDTTISLLQRASHLNMTNIIESCHQVLLTNFNLVTSIQLLDVAGKNLIALLDSGPSLVVDDEYSLFEKLELWLCRCEDDVLKRIVTLFRFHYMNAWQLNRASKTHGFARARSMLPDFFLKVWQMQTLYTEGYIEDLGEIACPRLYLHMPKGSDSTAQNKALHARNYLSTYTSVHIGDNSSHLDRISLWVREQHGKQYRFTQTTTEFDVIISATMNPESYHHIDLKLTFTLRATIWCKWRCHVAVETKQIGQLNQYFSQCLECQDTCHVDGNETDVGNERRKTIEFKIASFDRLEDKIYVRVAAILKPLDNVKSKCCNAASASDQR